MHYRPSPAELRKSFQLRAREFLRENSLHGFNYFVDPQRPMWERVFWFVCTLTSFCGALVSITIILTKFATQPMLTTVNIQNHDLTVHFPYVVICLSSEYLDLTTYTEEEATVLAQVYDWNWKPVASPKSLSRPITRGVYQRRLLIKDEMFTNCSFDESNDVPADCNEMLSPEWTEAGFCYVGGTKSIASRLQTLVMEFAPTSQKTLHLYLSADKFIPRGTPISYRLRSTVSLLLELEITITEENAHFINPRLRGCALPEESISYKLCQRNCHLAAFRRQNCTPWWFQDDEASACTPSQYNQVIDSKDEVMKCWSECPMACETTWYRIYQVRRNDNNSIIVRGLPLVIYKRKVILGLLELLVSFGGIMGLFLGYSLLITIEFIYYFTLRPYCGAVVPRKHGNIVSITVRPKPMPRKPLEGYTYRQFYLH